MGRFQRTKPSKNIPRHPKPLTGGTRTTPKKKPTPKRVIKRQSIKKRIVSFGTNPSGGSSPPNAWSFLPQAHASSTSNTAGKFNPTDWTGTLDYGTPGALSTQSVPSTRVSTGYGGLGVQGPKKKYAKAHKPVYVKSREGKTTQLDYTPSLQQRQTMHEAGYKLTTKKPSQLRQQQEWSDVHGITTYTQFGNISTTPRDLTGQKPNKIRAEQQKLSDKYNITTYNKDGSVSTIPSKQNQLAQDQPQQAAGVIDGKWWWDSPFSASAEKDQKEKPWGWW